MPTILLDLAAAMGCLTGPLELADEPHHKKNQSDDPKQVEEHAGNGQGHTKHHPHHEQDR